MVDAIGLPFLILIVKMVSDGSCFFFEVHLVVLGLEVLFSFWQFAAQATWFATVSLECDR